MVHTKGRMKQVVAVYVGVGAISLVIGFVIGWKLHGVRLGYIKKKREFHSLKAQELQRQLIN